MGLYDLILPVIESAAGSAALGGALWALSGRFHVSVPPNRALVLFGNHHSSSTPEVRGRPGDVTVRRARIVVGGRALVAPWNRAVGYLSLEPVVADVTVRSMQSLEGTHAAGWEVRIRAAAKIPTEPGLLVSAAENLLGKDEEEVRTIVRQAVEAAVPTVLARLRAGTTEPDWDRLAAEVQACVASDLVGWGLSVRSLSVTELHRIAPPEPLARRMGPTSISEPPPLGRSGESLGRPRRKRPRHAGPPNIILPRPSALLERGCTPGGRSGRVPPGRRKDSARRPAQRGKGAPRSAGPAAAP
jgi:hypothetical protein